MDPFLLAQQRRNAAINGADDAYNNTVSNLRRAAVAAAIAAGVGTHHMLMQSGAFVPPPSTRPRFPSQLHFTPSFMSPSAFRTSQELMGAELSPQTRLDIGSPPPNVEYYDFRKRASWLDGVRKGVKARVDALDALLDPTPDGIFWSSSESEKQLKFEQDWAKAGGDPLHVWKSTEEKAEMTDDLHNDLVYLDEYALGLAHEWGQSMATNSSVNVTEIENVHQVMKEQLFRISDLEGFYISNLLCTVFAGAYPPRIPENAFFHNKTLQYFSNVWPTQYKIESQFHIESVASVWFTEIMIDRYVDSQLYVPQFDEMYKFQVYKANIKIDRVLGVRANAVELKIHLRLIALMEIPFAYFRALQNLRPASKYLKLFQTHVASLAPAEAD